MECECQNPYLGHQGESESRSVVSDSLWPHGLYSPWNSPGQNTGVGSLSLLQGIFLTQELNWGLLHLQEDSLPTEISGKAFSHQSAESISHVIHHHPSYTDQGPESFTVWPTYWATQCWSQDFKVICVDLLECMASQSTTLPRIPPSQRPPSLISTPTAWARMQIFFHVQNHEPAWISPLAPPALTVNVLVAYCVALV